MNNISEDFQKHPTHCLNCGQAIQENFCSRCGQSTHIHRLSIWHFIEHDLIHSFWHVDHGIFFTIEEVLIRPGKAAMEYIRGKRVGRFPILTLILLLLAISFWIYSKSDIPHGNIQIIVNEADKGRLSESEILAILNRGLGFLSHYRKWIILSFLPFGSLASWIAFRKLRLNFTEHLLLNSYAFAGALVLIVLMQLFYLCLPESVDTIFWVAASLVSGLYLFAYAQAFRVLGVIGFVKRYAAFLVLYFFFLVFAVIIALVFVVENSGVLHS